ncbi:hypothetical protein GCM10018965_006000 [Nonomuraea roseola]
MWSMYIPSSLKATTSFTHIMQTKMPGTGTGPITVTSLRRVNDDEASPYDLVADSLFHALSDQLYAAISSPDFADRLGERGLRVGPALDEGEPPEPPMGGRRRYLASANRTANRTATRSSRSS